MASFDPSPYCVPGEITVHEAQHDLMSNVEGYKDLIQQLPYSREIYFCNCLGKEYLGPPSIPRRLCRR